jgi:hypothetical protein
MMPAASRSAPKSTQTMTTTLVSTPFIPCLP